MLTRHKSEEKKIDNLDHWRMTCYIISHVTASLIPTKIYLHTKSMNVDDVVISTHL